MTLTKFMARSTWVAYAFELGKLLKCHLKGKASRKLAKDRILKIQKKENGPRASSAPALELNTIIFIHVYWYMQQISGERLQDHWSSGVVVLIVDHYVVFFFVCVCLFLFVFCFYIKFCLLHLNFDFVV